MVSRRKAQSPIAMGLFDKSEMDKYAQELQAKMYSGQDVLAIRGLDKVQNISMNAQEMQMFEQLGGTNDDVEPFLRLSASVADARHQQPLQRLSRTPRWSSTPAPSCRRSAAMEKEIARKLIGFGLRCARHPHLRKAADGDGPERQGQVLRACCARAS